MLARLKASQASSSLGMRRSEESAPTSSPRTTSPSGTGDGEEVPQVATPPDSAAVDVVSPAGGSGKPPSPVTEEERVTKMTGGLEFLKLGEGAENPPVVRRGEAGVPVKLSTNYIRLELAEDR